MVNNKPLTQFLNELSQSLDTVAKILYDLKDELDEYRYFIEHGEQEYRVSSGTNQAVEGSREASPDGRGGNTEGQATERSEPGDGKRSTGEVGEELDRHVAAIRRIISETKWTINMDTDGEPELDFTIQRPGQTEQRIKRRWGCPEGHNSQYANYGQHAVTCSLCHQSYTFTDKKEEPPFSFRGWIGDLSIDPPN